MTDNRGVNGVKTKIRYFVLTVLTLNSVNNESTIVNTATVIRSLTIVKVNDC